MPIHIYEAITGKPVAMIRRPGKTPNGAEVAMVLRHVIRNPQDRSTAHLAPRLYAAKIIAATPPDG